MLTVACCLWKEFPAPGWSERYVQRLRNGVRRHLARPFNFVCFSDRPLVDVEGVEVRKLTPPSWWGNLPKTFVYSPDAGLDGRVLLFDLDNVIVGSLDDMAAYDGPLCVRGRLLQHRSHRLPDGDMLSFDRTGARRLWSYAQRSDVVAHTAGRERQFIAWAFPSCHQWQDICPGQVVSYRYDCKRGLPPEARVVSMHGKPRPHEVADPFIVENWQ